MIGLGVPKSWAEAAGISEGLYHFSAATKMDKAMYAVLATVIVLGLANTVAANIFGHYDYREGVPIWFRGISRFALHPELMATAPLGYLTRPCIVYRSRDPQLGTHRPRRGWERTG